MSSTISPPGGASLGLCRLSPLIAVIAAILRPFTKDNLFALHVVTALASAILIVVTGLIARELGGGHFAQGWRRPARLWRWCTWRPARSSPTTCSMSFWWGLGAYVLVRLLKRHTPRLWRCWPHHGRRAVYRADHSLLRLRGGCRAASDACAQLLSLMGDLRWRGDCLCLPGAICRLECGQWLADA